MGLERLVGGRGEEGEQIRRELVVLYLQELWKGAKRVYGLRMYCCRAEDGIRDKEM